MAKILITSIGTGIKNEKTQEYEYTEVNYSYKGSVMKTPYIYDALDEFIEYDKIIFIGTAGSNWAALYWFVSRDMSDFNIDYCLELEDLFKRADKDLYFVEDIKEKLNPLKDAFSGKCADIIVLKYGLNDEENMENFKLLSGIGEHVNDGDSITFDITHSFRSLAFYELLAVNYIKDALGKKISIDFVSYGMNDAKNRVSPIVDLSILIKMMNWIKVGEEYERHGTAHLLNELIESDSLGIDTKKEENKAIKRLGSEIISTNNLDEFENLIKNCINIDKSTNRSDMVFAHIYKDLSKRFSEFKDDKMLLSIKFAKWHCEKGRYINAGVSLVDGTIKFCANLAGVNTKDNENLWKYNKTILGLCESENKIILGFASRYAKLNRTRNDLAHANEIKKEDIIDFKKNLDDFEEYYIENFKNSKENEELLAKTLSKEPASER